MHGKTQVLHCAHVICCDQTGKGKQEGIVPNAHGKKWVATDVGSACMTMANICIFCIFCSDTSRGKEYGNWNMG